MPAAVSGPVRLARASVVAAVTVALSLGAHVLAGGTIPPPMLLGPLLAVVLAAAVPVVGRRIGTPGAIAMLALGQLGMHHALDALAGMGCAPAAPLAGHVHVVQVACTTAPQHLATPHVAGLGGSAMLVLHVVATVVAALLIAGIDHALTWVKAWLSPLVTLLEPVALPAFAVLPVQVETSRVVGRRDVGVVPLRGPPTSPAHVTLAA